MSDRSAALRSGLVILIVFAAAMGVWGQSAGDLYQEGRELFRQGRIPEARQKFEAAAKIAAATGNERDLCDAYLGIAMMDQSSYAYESALGYYLKVKELAEQLVYDGPLVSYYNNVGAIYTYQGRIKEALELYRHSLELRVRLYGPEDAMVAVVYNNLGTLYDRQGDKQKAIENLEKARAIREKELGPMHIDTATTWSNLAGALASDFNRAGEAIDYLQKALRVYNARFPPDHPSIALTYEGIANLYMNDLSGRYAEAEEHYLKALQILQKRGLGRDFRAAFIQAKLGDIGNRKADYTAARDRYMAAVSILDELRNHIGLDSTSKANYLANFVGVYKQLALTAARLGDAGLAFQYAELSKSRSLLEDVGRNAVWNAPEIDPARLKPLAELRQRAQALEQAAAGKRLRGAAATAEEVQLAKLTGEYDARLKELYSRYPRFKAMADSPIISLKAAQGLLDDKTALIEYCLARESEMKIVALVLTRERAECLILPALGTSDMVKSLRRRILGEVGAAAGERGLLVEEETAAKPDAGVEDAAEALYRVLIEPLAAKLKNKNRLIIVPDKELAFVPFETLKSPGGRYLIEDKDVSYVQSASLASRLSRKSAPGRLPFLAFGGAWYQTAGASSKPAAGRGLDVEQDGASPAAAYADKGYNWKNLPGTEDEVKAAVKLFYPEREAADHLLLGAEVNEARVKELSSRERLLKYAYIHFAAHGIANPETPALSALVLSQPAALKAGGRAAAGDGYLTMGEIAALRLDADLVTLSACQTGLGKLLDGEGVVGLSQSFLLAGAKNVCVSLWSVADDATKEFMVKFYTRVKQGESFAAALSQVKREFIKGRYKDPFYWAPFVLYGAP